LAAIRLIQQASGVVEEGFVVIEIGYLDAREKFPESTKITSLIIYDDEN